MNDSTGKLMDGLRQAIQTEADGYQFYTMASETTKDSKGRQTFKILAGEELKHLDFLRSQYKSVVDTGVINPKLKIGEQHDFSNDPIFSDEILDRIGDAQFEMSALSIGMQLELSSIRYYQEQAEESDNVDVAAFYYELVDWEKNHYEALERQQEMLKEDFWAKGGFAPF
jgi:rubrerythrin